MNKNKLKKLEEDKIALNIVLKKLERNFYPKQKKLKERIAEIEEEQRKIINVKLF